MSTTGDRLFEAALERFLENGYEETTVAEITEAAGVSHMSFFRRFPTKSDIIISNMANDEWGASVVEAPADLGPAAAVLWGFVHSMDREMANDPVLVEDVVKIVASSDELTNAMYGHSSPTMMAVSGGLEVRGIGFPERVIISRALVAGLGEGIRRSPSSFSPHEVALRFGGVILSRSQLAELEEALN